MKRNSKRFLSLFITVPMTLSLMATPVFATVPDNAAAPVVSEQENAAAPEATEEQGSEAAPETAEETQQDPAVSAPETTEETQENTEVPQETAEPAEQAQDTTITINDSLSTFTIDASKIEAPEINVNEMQLTEEELNSVDESDPEIATIKEELQNIKVLNADGESVPLTEEQIQTVLGMYSEYQQQWQDNADVLGVQSPFYLQFNDNGEDGLGVLGEMLTLAGVSVEDVRSGNYSYDDLTGMIMNFLYGDQFGIEYYGEMIRTKRDEALEAVNNSGAQTDVQKIMALNTWLSQNNTFDMSYIMNQMGDEPVMTAEDPQQNEHYDEIYAAMEAVYRPQIEAQFQSQFRTVAEQQVGLAIWQNAIQNAVAQQYQAENPDATEEEVSAYAEQYMTDNAEAIAADPRAYVVSNLGGEEVAAQMETQVNGYLASEEGQAAVESAYTQIMDTQIPDLGNMTPNQAIDVYTQQAAAGLTDGILGYWEGNHIGALAEGKSVCMGYAKAFAYLMQCMYPEIYLKDGATDINVASNWKTAADLYYDENGNLDISQNYNVDLVRITFNASVSMYGEPQPDFSSDHFWNAVKIDGKWYYVDPCYTDVFSEVMNRDRVETNGYMNHTYFMISHSSLAEMFDGNYSEIKTLYADCDGTTVNEDYTSSDYEGSWVTRVVSNVYSDGEYIYYMYDSTDLLEMLREFNNSQGNYQEMDIEDAVYKIVRHKMTDTDLGDGDTDYETLIDFNSGDSVTVYNPETGEMEANEMLTELYANFVEEQSVYPAIHTTPVLYGEKLYFNVSNSILSYDLATGAVAEVEEYNTVNVVRDKTEVFGAMGFDVDNSAEEPAFIFENHPIAGMTLKGDGTLYVDIATNLSYIAGRDPHDYTDSSSYGYEFEESNHNPDYNEFAAQMMEDQGISDDMLEQLGYKREINDNAEFMWVANATETLDMAHFAGDTHEYSTVTVDPYCGRDGFTEDRCTTCGAIEAESRVVDEDSAYEGHHYILFSEEYYTKDENENWNSGDTYVCAVCGFHIAEPTEPKQNSYVTEEEYQELLAQYEEDKAIYDEAVATAGHTYTAADPQWSEDFSSVTFSNLVCSSVCNERKETLDLLMNDATISAALEAAVTAEASLTSAEGTCAEGVTSTYTAEGEAEGHAYSVSTTTTWEAGDHNYVNGKCTKCGELDPNALVAPEIESVYSRVQTSAKVTWNQVENADGYELWRATSSDAAEEDWALTKTITDPETVQYTNTGLTVGQTYYYKVRAYKGDKEIFSEFSAVDYMPSSIVVDNAYSNLPTRIRFVWQPVDGATEYQLWRKDAGADDSEYKIVKVIKDQAITAYSNVDLTPGETYTYKMRAVTIKEDGTLVYSAYTDEMTIATLSEATTLAGTAAGAGRANLAWEAVAGADGYRIWMAESEDGDYTVAKMINSGDTVSYTKSDLESGKTYYFKVAAYTDVDGKITFGQESNVISVTVE